MATFAANNLTLADVAKRKDPDGKTAKIVELLNEDHQVLEYATFQECNDGTNNKTTVRTGLPGGTWRKLYGGIQSTKSSTAQVVDSCGMLEALPMIDVDVVDKSTDPSGTLLSESQPHLEGMKQDLETTLFYGDTALYPERFMGLAPRYDAYTRSTPDDTKSDYNVFHAAGAGSDNTSIWLITWGPNACHMLYPKGSKAGLMQENLGKQLIDAADNSGKFLAYATHYKWDVGLCIRDWRSVGRICNIDVSNLEAESSAADIVKFMIKLSERVKTSMGRPVWVMHERVKTMLRIQALSKSQYMTTFETVEGREVQKFGGIPIAKSDKILLTEAVVPQAS